MSDGTQAKLIRLAQTSVKSPVGGSASRLCRRLRSMTARMRQYYLSASQKERQSADPAVRAVEEWLCDNYYVLEKESKQSIKDIRAFRGRAAPDELERFCALFDCVLREMPALCDETVSVVLSAAGKVRSISESQFGFVPTAIKAALVGMAYDACFSTHSEQMMRYAITGLGKLSDIDFDEIIYACSAVERILMTDPAGVYPAMDADSRKYYRRLVALIAARTGSPEQEVAEQMLAACTAEPECADTQSPRRHIGYHILRSPCVRRPRLIRGKAALAAGIALPLICCAALGILTGSVAAGILCFLPLMEVLRTPLWQLAMSGVEADFIPRMDPKKLESKPGSVVLLSTLLPDVRQIPALEDRLQQLYFSNSDPDMYYCVLADFKEWSLPSDEKDDAQVNAAVALINELNRRHGPRFMLFLRARSFSKTQGRYCGWERKRGAITEFIRFLRGEKTGPHTFAGEREALRGIKYIIALDYDTSLLYECAQTLVCAAIHPLNRPVIDKNGVVTEGYGILAPKISPDLMSARATGFSRVMSGCGGVTAYETRDKDFYQDLFFESIFAGKGLIDIDAFDRTLTGRLPESQILSHDILEGAYLRAAFVSDANMTDASPLSMSSWLSRLHRWIRGDWQNIIFIARGFRLGNERYRNPISALSRYKLLDNLRRSLTPPASLICLIAALFLPGAAGIAVAVAGVLGVMFPSLWAAYFSLLSGGLFTLSRKFFTRTLPHALELIAQGVYLLIMLPAQSIITLDAVLRSLWRTFISRKKLLEWTTAAQSEGHGTGAAPLLARYWPAQALGLCYLLLVSPSALSLAGACFSIFIPVALLSAKPSPEAVGTLSAADRETLYSYNAAMWRYYEEFANAENHFLPPDNIQQSPVYRVANRTSPTNIGMMLLSVLAARDFDFIDTRGMYLRIERTFSTVERLKVWHGNLCNWYDTLTLDTLKPEFISTVDSGNFICCLVALAEGLREFERELPELGQLIARIENMTQSADLGVFYNKKKNLFSIGYDAESGEMSGSHYDFLMSEARLTSYYAIARKLVGKKHWGSLIRTMSRSGSYAGAVSWTGTMFEYFMPHLLLPVYDGSLLGEALIYCLYCQKRRTAKTGAPWGISESAFYAFDNNLNYQYKAHGVQKLGVKRNLDRELVISPYSSFLSIPLAPNSSMRNLSRLHELGVYGRYGFFEAVDFTSERVGNGGLSVTRSYMAHHIGMSMLASCNALLDGRMQRRFMKNHYMRSAQEFLQEKIAKNTVVYDNLTPEARGEKHERPTIREETRVVYPQAPRATLITNGEITDILTDTGAGYLALGDIDLTRRSTDLPRRAQGIFTLVRINGATIPASQAPFFDQKTEYRVEYQERGVTYYAKKRDAEVGVRCLMHPTISCEQRQIVVKNSSAKKQSAQVLVYLEPVLSTYRDYSAHPAYSKLFVCAGYDDQSKTLTFRRRGRDGARGVYLTIGFLQETSFTFETRREALMSAPHGLADLKSFYKKNFSGGAPNTELGVPDACCALRFELSVPAGGQQQATLLLCASRTEAEGISSIIAMRKLGLLDAKSAASSPLLGDSLEGRLGSGILGQLLFPHSSRMAEQAKSLNKLGQSGLWSAGISGDLPIALLCPEDGSPDGSGESGGALEARMTALDSYLKLHCALRGVGVEFDLVILYEQAKSRDELLAHIGSNSLPGLLGARGGVFLLHRENTAPELITLLFAVARHVFPGGHEQPSEPFSPAELLPLSPEPLPENPELSIPGGVFNGGRFHVEKSSPLPWCHILSNPSFGTLVSDRALGYTWAFNSRENKLTPWYNDIASDNTGELLLLSHGGRIFNLIHGARASFSSADACWQGRCGVFSSSVRVTVPARGCAKRIELTLQNRTDITQKLKAAYYTEPVLGVSRDTAGSISARDRDGVLLLRNCYNTAVPCHSAIAVPGRNPRFTTGRAAFLSGNWSRAEVRPEGDPCAAAILDLELAPREQITLLFILACGRTESGAYRMATLPHKSVPDTGSSLRIRTPDPALDAFVNTLLPHQILACRIRGRTAFYQCGGAYGFRDQLQDAMAYQLLDPEVLRRQIIRCCAVQFEQGDVLHWWHNLPRVGDSGGIKGVRTRFSDDLLWLPLAAAEYVAKTGDHTLLDVPVRYLAADELAAGQQERYISPRRSELREDVYSHCVRALERGYRLGEDGLPLIGCGDWNDGFSTVGAEGRGRSVWLALFLVTAMESFAPLCETRGQQQLAKTLRERAEGLRAAVDESCWDGQWYLRAFYDNGEKMGSHIQSECHIDLLPQSFAVLAGLRDRQRVSGALDCAWERLVDHRLRLIRLFTAAFRHSAQQPGYIKAYPEGIRENGGQYTHAAVWFAIALLRHGRNADGWQLLQMLNPVNRASHRELSDAYKLEPYYIAADIYTNDAAPGRGGWSIYTGAASWYLRAVCEELFGLKLEGERLMLNPRLPPDWDSAELSATIRGTRLAISFRRGESPELFVDGKAASHVPLDGGEHKVVVSFIVTGK